MSLGLINVFSLSDSCALLAFLFLILSLFLTLFIFPFSINLFLYFRFLCTPDLGMVVKAALQLVNDSEHGKQEKEVAKIKGSYSKNIFLIKGLNSENEKQSLEL